MAKGEDGVAGRRAVEGERGLSEALLRRCDLKNEKEAAKDGEQDQQVGQEIFTSVLQRMKEEA